MLKNLGIAGLLLVVCLVGLVGVPAFGSPENVENLIRRTALFGVLSIGVAFVIVTGGIDLSIGSVVCLVGVLLPRLLVEGGWPVGVALAAVLGLSALIGLAHGLLITRLRLQPFIVTLCGLLLYRGLARWITGDQTQGFGSSYEGLKELVRGRIPLTEDFALPVPTLILVVVAVAAALFLDRTVGGRYLLALGRNEQAARYSGIRTEAWTVFAYVLCSLLAGFGGVLFVLDVNSAQASTFGNFYELYAIAGAVLGGCALRGGEGSIVGVLMGTALMQVLRNMATLYDPRAKQLEFAIIGAVILAGVAADEVLRRAVRRWRRPRGG